MPEELHRRINQYEKSFAIASIVLDEMRFGALRLPSGISRLSLLNAIDELLRNGVPVLPFDQIAAEWHAAERARLSKLGQTPPFVDGQIAAVAAANNLTLATLNARDFEPFEGLQVEAW